MNPYDLLVLLILLALLFLAFRSWHHKKKENCARGGCANCPKNPANCQHKKEKQKEMP